MTTELNRILLLDLHDQGLIVGVDLVKVDDLIMFDEFLPEPAHVLLHRRLLTRLLDTPNLGLGGLHAHSLVGEPRRVAGRNADVRWVEIGLPIIVKSSILARSSICVSAITWILPSGTTRSLKFRARCFSCSEGTFVLVVYSIARKIVNVTTRAL